MEINHEMEGSEEDDENGLGKAAIVSFSATIVQIILLDIIFSFDSILTAVGIVPPEQVVIMIIAVVVSIFVMMFFSGAISDFIKQHPSMEVLALGFLILIGFTLLLEGLHKEIPKGYIYFAVAFSLLIEFTNIRVRKKRKKKTVKLNKPYDDQELKEAVEELSR
jgi:predicted tellurium resistance membrane protein TerC